ncbi:hypothetical protein V502_00572 [Pseudogymnoascus sp. VKM F-4520 (FW-2644)]|nr:hypothetical protein V502_00572 [Pseudogymnoascus sp. VKM F-4520 (FW-2644)]
MDESGFGIRESQTTRVLVLVKSNQKHKSVVGKQEWVTNIECITAAGMSLTLIIIFKAKNLNSSWLPSETPSNWHFAVSENSWTSNDLGLHWLIKVFEPQTREIAVNQQRLLIADGHGSHIRADFIAYWEIDAVSQHSSQRILRAEEMQMFIQARKKAVTLDNILSGWRAQPPSALQKPHTPPTQDNLDLSLLKSSPPDGTELRESNVLLNSVLIQVPGLASPAKRYVDRVTRMAETQNTELIILRKQLQEKEELLQAQKAHTRGKKVRLEGKFVYSTQDVLDVAREVESKPVAKRPCGRLYKRPIKEVKEEEEVEVLENSLSTSDNELVDYVARRTRSKRTGSDLLGHVAH